MNLTISHNNFDASIGRYNQCKIDEIKYLEDFLFDKNLFTYLDIGTCSGRYPSYFKTKFKSILGIDINSKSIDFCKEKIKGVDFLVADITIDILKIKKNYREKFDLITMMMGTINHIPKHKHNYAFSNIKKIMNFNSTLIVSEINEYDYDTMSCLYKQDEMEKLKINNIEKKIFIEQGLEVIEYKKIDFLNIYILKLKRND